MYFRSDITDRKDIDAIGHGVSVKRLYARCLNIYNKGYTTAKMYDFEYYGVYESNQGKKEGCYELFVSI